MPYRFNVFSTLVCERLCVIIGTWMEGRDEFVAKLVKAVVLANIFRSRWEKSPHYAEITDVVASKGLSVNE